MLADHCPVLISQPRFLHFTLNHYTISSQTKGLLINPDKSVDVYFGPKAPTGKENNWVQTIPGKG
jgi:hypothetical protein